MKNLSDYFGETLKLIEPSMMKQVCELRDGDSVVASIKSPKVFGSMMITGGEFGNWKIYKPSFWKSSLAIREQGKELPLASFKRKAFSSKGTVYLPVGEQFQIVFHAFKSHIELFNSSGERLVLFTPRFSWGGEKIDVVVEKKSELLDKYPWVVMLVWYLAAQRKRAHAVAH